MSNSGAAWGDDQTRFFFDLTPDRVLEAVEAGGLACTGRCMALNSFENRVYDVELERSESDDSKVKMPNANRRIIKFYRPGRWNEKQIQEEHQFLADLKENEIPAIAPIAFPTESGETKTIHVTSKGGIYYSLFPRVGGRAPDELNDDQLIRIGRLLGRIHNVGASQPAPHRIRLTTATYGRANLDFLLSGNWIPLEYRERYREVVTRICDRVEPWFKDVEYHRVHGDCHLGNLLWNDAGPFFLDFDDMVMAPAAQDIWLLVPGRDADAMRQREMLLEGYEEMRHFNRSTLRLIEPLRALRFVHYTAWIARRWQDPAFPLAFPEFGSHQYWADETGDLEEQWRLISSVGV